MRFPFFLTLLAPALATPSPAGAQPRAPEPPPSAWDVAGVRGFELQASGGVAYGGGGSPVEAPNVYGRGFASLNPAGTILNPAGAKAANQSFTPYSYDPFGFAFSAGYRPATAWSVGAFFSYANYGSNADPSTGDFPDGTGGLERVRWTLGGYARYYLTWWSSRLHPWVLAGVGYVDDSASYAHPGPPLPNGAGPDNGNYLIHYHGLAIPLSLGLDWRLAPGFAVGPVVTYEGAFPLGGCVRITVDQTVGSFGPVATCDGSVVETHSYASVFAGIYAKVTLGG